MPFALSAREIDDITSTVRDEFQHFRIKYDLQKYPQAVYLSALDSFRSPTTIPVGTLREVLLWKYGHLGKARIPGTHDRLILQIQNSWYGAAIELPVGPEQTFDCLNRAFGTPKRFITVAFLTHLLRPRQVPLIDRHNFRAFNLLMSRCRSTWEAKERPTRFSDLTALSTFMAAIRHAWGSASPSLREMDMFLMMYGKYNT